MNESFSRQALLNEISKKEQVRQESFEILNRAIDTVNNMNDYYKLINSRGYKGDINHPIVRLKNRLNPGNDNYSGNDLVGRFRTTGHREMSRLLGFEVGNPDQNVNPRKTEIWDASIPSWRNKMHDWVEKNIKVTTEIEDNFKNGEFQVVSSQGDNNEFSNEILSLLNNGDFKSFYYDDEKRDSIHIASPVFLTIDASDKDEYDS